LSIQDLGNVGEFIAALATIATLIYLSIQVRENTKMNKSVIREQRTNSDQQLLYKYVENADIMLEQGEIEPESALSEFKLHAMIRAEFRGYEAYVHHYSDNLFDDDEWNGMLETIKWRLESPATLNFWETNKHHYSKQLNNTVKELLK
jgi:hypothetical protein